MWTRADAWHVHAISGGLHTIIGLFYLLDILVGDVVRLNGGQWSEHVPFELVLASMVFGAVNAVSGLQPTLLPRPTETLPQLLGFGEDGNLQAAGFVNTAGFYFFLTYQSLRVLPEYPVWLQPLDPVFSATAFVAIFHAIFLINSWVSRGKLSRVCRRHECATLAECACVIALGFSRTVVGGSPFRGISWLAGSLLFGQLRPCLGRLYGHPRPLPLRAEGLRLAAARSDDCVLGPYHLYGDPAAGCVAGAAVVPN